MGETKQKAGEERTALDLEALVRPNSVGGRRRHGAGFLGPEMKILSSAPAALDE